MSDDRKTELPTKHKLDRAKERGNSPVSKDIVAFFTLGYCAVFFAWIIEPVAKQVSDVSLYLTQFFSHAYSAESLFAFLGFKLSASLALPVLLILFCVFVGNFIQRGGIVFSFYPIKPSIERISLLKGFNRVFSSKSVFEFFNSLVKLIIIMAVIFSVIKFHMVSITYIHKGEVVEIIGFAQKIILSVIIYVILIMAFIAIIDLLYRRFAYTQDMKMTKEELRDELKQQELSPEVKSKLRKIRAERVKYHLMMSTVGTADVVIVNPDHYAVALKYDSKEMPSPKVIAKGKGYVALRIKSLAQSSGVVVVQNKVLAKALYQSVGLNEFIPAVHYKAVAEVINYVYRIRRQSLMNTMP